MAIRFFAAAVASLGLMGSTYADQPAATPAPMPVPATTGCCAAQANTCCNQNQGRTRIGFRNRTSNQCCNAPVQQCCSAPVAQVQTCCTAPVNTCNTCCNTGMSTYRTGLLGRRTTGNYATMAPMTYQPMMVMGTAMAMPTTSGTPMVVQAGGQQPSTTAPRPMTGGTPAPVAGNTVAVAPVSGDCGCTNGSYNTSSRRFFNRGFRRW